MSKIHIATPEGQTEHEEAELRALWHQGKFPANTKYWTQGMTDWQPLASYFADSPFNPYASNPHVESAPTSVGNPRYAYVQSPHTLTRFLLVMLWICLAGEILRIASDGMQLSLLSRTYTAEGGVANDQRQSIIAVGWVIAFFSTSIPFLKWTHRVNVNCRGFGARMMLTPGWAVGSFFVPILNLFRPYQAMKQVWQVSKDPENWLSQKGTALVGVWWALWLLGGVVGQVAGAFSKNATTMDGLIVSTGVSIASDLVGAFVTVAAILLVRGISRMQEALLNPAPEAADAVP